MKATAKELRFHAKELLEAVRRGEEVTITYRGKPCAKMIPIEQAEGDSDAEEFFGIWREYDKTADVSRYVRELRSGRFG